MKRVGSDTIVAVATPPGRGAIGIVRASGADAGRLASAIIGRTPVPRRAELADFLDASGEVIDHGILLYYRGPASYTGEDAFELQAHGSPVILDTLVTTLTRAGARLARPGEFTERAFLNGKLDLTQAEAVADLINARTQAAARAATRSLAGEFSRRIDTIVEALTQIRVRVEAAIDFPEEELDLPDRHQLVEALGVLSDKLQTILKQARDSSILIEGARIVLAGAPNVGKSSLMNLLIGDERVIVSDTPGTTRDVVEHHTAIHGLPVTLVDTAGLRDTGDSIEKEGVSRAQRQIASADHVLLMLDDTQTKDQPVTLPDMRDAATIRVRNKIDLSGRAAGRVAETSDIAISARTGAGIGHLKDVLARAMGHNAGSEAPFVARRRHVTALEQAANGVKNSVAELDEAGTLELAAEELRLAQGFLGEITGIVSSDDILGRIFADFCIGK